MQFHSLSPRAIHLAGVEVFPQMLGTESLEGTSDRSYMELLFQFQFHNIYIYVILHIYIYITHNIFLLYYICACVFQLCLICFNGFIPTYWDDPRHDDHGESGKTSPNFQVMRADALAVSSWWMRTQFLSHWFDVAMVWFDRPPVYVAPVAACVT